MHKINRAPLPVISANQKIIPPCYSLLLTYYSSVVSGDDATIDGLFATFLRGGAGVLAAVAGAAGILFSFRNPFPEQTNAT